MTYKHSSNRGNNKSKYSGKYKGKRKHDRKRKPLTKEQRFEMLFKKFESQSKERLKEYKARQYHGKKGEVKARAAKRRRVQHGR